jgi:DNA-binding FrmR family transcriptional regulator
MTCCAKPKHPSHKQQSSRLNRIAGQIEGVKRMIDDQRYCPDILIQCRAIRSAIKSLESSIMEVHLKNCVAETLNSGQDSEKQEKIGELLKLFYRFE